MQMGIQRLQSLEPLGRYHHEGASMFLHRYWLSANKVNQLAQTVYHFLVINALMRFSARLWISFAQYD